MKISLLTPGRILRDRYKILDMIGHGGMGAVYLADDLLTDENIAVKQTFYNDEELAKAFYYEARLLARLKHPAFPKVTDFFAEDDSRFLVMEFIEGDDLSCRFDRKGRCPPLTFEEVIKIAKQLFEALSFLHAKNIVHRDIKPSNLIFTADEQLRILD
ncbi:MAG TPA: serine/threonine-protein kinase, partial [Pyrinomonadaceae bacterium]|nr:serine/threonine-protein kinase [Pyrinomonadaceae bacterium]